jgi:hypothetical protein
MDIQLGDLVRVKYNESAPYHGWIGTVVEILPEGTPYPITVDLRPRKGTKGAKDVPYTEAELKVIS